MIATKTIPLMVPYIAPGTVEAVSRTLSTRWVGEGPQVKEFERRFSEQIAGGRPCVAVSSCTASLHLAYLLAGIGPNDELIVPNFTCTAGNEATHYGEAGAKYSLWSILKQMWSRRSWYWTAAPKLRFCDVAKNSLNMDPTHCRSLINERTKAIVVVNYGGRPVSHDFFEMGLPVIEDCAQSLGSDAGIRGDFACFSFQAVKAVTTQDGGMLVLPNWDWNVEKVKRLRWFGIDRAAKLAGTWANDIKEVAYKYQMGDMSASMGLCGLDSLDAQITLRRAMRDAYVSNLTNFDGIQVLDQDPESACWLCTVLVERREDFKKKLASEGIESDQVHYRNDRYTIFKDFRGEFPNMDAIDGKYLCIPLHMGMDLGDVERICDVIRSGW